MAYTTIKKPSDYFNTKLYSGNGSTQSITGVGFQPDWCWIKSRSQAYNHTSWDAVRGAGERLIPNATDAEETQTGDMSAFITDGFTLGGGNVTNQSSQTYASWNWLANGTGVANTDGSISSTVSANTTSGFSIVSYTGTGANATVGHGLGSVPKMMIIKNRDSAEEWGVYHVANGNTHVQYLNTTGAKSDDAGFWNDTTPTSSVFTVGNSTRVNQNGSAMIAYCFAEKQGYSKFGSYTGNGSTDGAFVYTGLKPAFILAKRTDSTSGWGMYDNKREPYNLNDTRLLANTSGADDTSTDNGIDFLSNGFKWRTASGWNASASYIYMAFAEEPLVGDNPATAR
ncbi:hypothetical protein N9J01_00300 [bacterium]|nr:hypothetical protein [bacterium]